MTSKLSSCHMDRACSELHAALLWYRYFNAVQSEAFPVAFNSDVNMVRFSCRLCCMHKVVCSCLSDIYKCLTLQAMFQRLLHILNHAYI